MAPAVDVLERLVEEGKLRHGGHPVLAMAAANAKVELDAAGNRKISKRRSIGRVDPLVALCMALGVAARPAPVIDIEAFDRVMRCRVGRTTRRDGNGCASSSFQENPLCETCLGQQRLEPATAVDHIIPVKAPGGEAYIRRSTACARSAPPVIITKPDTSSLVRRLQ